MDWTITGEGIHSSSHQEQANYMAVHIYHYSLCIPKDGFAVSAQGLPEWVTTSTPRAEIPEHFDAPIQNHCPEIQITPSISLHRHFSLMTRHFVPLLKLHTVSRALTLCTDSLQYCTVPLNSIPLREVSQQGRT